MSRKNIKESESSEPPGYKSIIKRRLVNFKKQYLFENEGFYTWRPNCRSIQREADSYDQEFRNLLPYFPAVLEAPSKKVKIFFEDKRLQVTYADRPISIDFKLSKKAMFEVQK